MPINLPIEKAACLVADKIVTSRINHHNVSITLHSASGTDEGAFYPAQDVQVYGKKGVTALRDFLNDTLKDWEQVEKENRSPYA